jgi:hypothetical protein
MAQNTRSKKRPCRICGKWFTPNPRLGDRQKTCGTETCKKQWHAAKCAQWNRQNKSYFKEIYLRSRMDAASPDDAEVSPASRGSGLVQAPSPLDIPSEVVQEVMGVQQRVIIEYIARILLRSVQEAMDIQHLEISKEIERLVGATHPRGDSHPPPAGVSSSC